MQALDWQRKLQIQAASGTSGKGRIRNPAMASELHPLSSFPLSNHNRAFDSTACTIVKP